MAMAHPLLEHLVCLKAPGGGVLPRFGGGLVAAVRAARDLLCKPFLVLKVLNGKRQSKEVNRHTEGSRLVTLEAIALKQKRPLDLQSSPQKE